MATVAPLLTVRSIERSCAWYRDVLGAAGRGAFPPGPWGWVTHGEVDLHGQKLMFTPDQAPPGSEGMPWRTRALGQEGPRGAGFVVQVNLDDDADIDAFCAEVRRKGATVVVPPTDQAWGARIFLVEDPDGYLVLVHRMNRRRDQASPTTRAASPSP